MTMKTIKLCFGLISLFLFLDIQAQNISVDGNLEEDIWKEATEYTLFKTYKPAIGRIPSERTTVFITNDSLFLYVGVHAFDSDPSAIRANLTNRDNLSNDDVFTLEMDVNGSANSNIFFRVNPLGIQEDGVITKDEDEDLNPDKIWYSKGMITDFGYSVELAIPFQSLRFKWEPQVEMKMGFTRKIFRKSELVVYPEYNSELSNRLLQRETVYFSNVKKKRILELIPSLTYTYEKVRENGKWDLAQNKLEAGVTGKIGITSDLVLDLTYNPDFSQIESDAGKIDINLRNPLYFPEKRPFFQEGIELFNYGGQSIYHIPLRYIVHTRNIVNPSYGVKFTGNLGKNYSLATIVSNDEKSEGNDDHYQIFRMQRKLKGDSYLGVTYTGKENGEFYNRVGGFDGKIRLNGNNSIEYNFFRSSTQDSVTSYSGNTFGAHYNFRNQYHDVLFGYYQNDENFHTETGYLTRKGIHVFPFHYNLNKPLQSEKINKLGVWLSGRPKIDMKSDKFEYWTYAGFELYFKNDSWLYVGKSFSEEIFQNQRFKAGDIAGGLFIQFNQYLYLNGVISWANKIYYDRMNPYQGEGLSTNGSLLFTPTNQLKIKLSANYANFYRSSNNEFVYDYTLARLHTTYQINKNVFVRAVGEYNFYKDNLSSELLVSFTSIPGTVLQLGYNVNAQKNTLDEFQNNCNNLKINKNLVFFKASYLFKK